MNLQDDRTPQSGSPARVKRGRADDGAGTRRSHGSQLDAARQDLLREIDRLDARLKRQETMAGWLLASPVLRAGLGHGKALVRWLWPGRTRPPDAAGPTGEERYPDPGISVLATLADGIAARAPAPAPPRGDHRLRVAGIVDEFTQIGLAPDCELTLLGVEDWQRELEAARPDLLFVESAWKGNGGKWRDKLVPVSRELHGVLEWCGRNAVPTVFWNKEDPTHFEHFLPVARHFDFIYTTAAECVPLYRAALGRDSVGLLPFACQPRVHNPVQAAGRKDAAFFAGTYYNRYRERQADFDRMVDSISPLLAIDIYDRNHGSGIRDFEFPERYRKSVRHGLPAERIDEVYKAYRFGLNLNTVKDSSTMFARRVHELLACNTVTLSNPSTGMQRLFGDLVIVEGPGFVESRLQPLLEDDGQYRRFRLAGLRKVMAEHTWGDRVAQLSREVLGWPVDSAPPSVVVVALVRSQADVDRVAAAFARQRYHRKQLVLVVGAAAVVPPRLACPVRTLTVAEAMALRPAEAWPGSFIAGFSSSDYYAPDYLVDMALGFRFFTGDVVGKACHYRWERGRAVLDGDGAQYRPGERLRERYAMVRAGSIGGSVAQWAEAIDTDDAPWLSGLSLDEFDYCRDAGDLAVMEVESSLEIDHGMSLDDFVALGDRSPHAEGTQP